MAENSNKLIFSYDFNSLKNKISFRTNIFKIENILIMDMMELIREIPDIENFDEYEIQLLNSEARTLKGKFKKGDVASLELNIKMDIFDVKNKVDEAIEDIISINKKNTYVKDFYLQRYSDFKPNRIGKLGDYDKFIDRKLKELIGQAVIESSLWHNLSAFDFRICLGADFVHIKGKFEQNNEESFWKSLQYAMSTHTYLDFFINYYIVGLKNSSWEFEVMGYEDKESIVVLYDAFAFNKKLMWESIWHSYAVSESRLSNWFIKNLLVNKIQIAIETIASSSPHLDIRINNEVATTSLMIRILKSTIGVKKRWFEEFIEKYPNLTLNDLNEFIASKDDPKLFPKYFKNFVKYAIPEYKFLRADQKLLVEENYKTLKEITFYSTITALLGLG